MTPLHKAVFLLLSSLPVHTTDRDEDPLSRSERLSDIALVVSIVAPSINRSTTLIETGRSETHFARYVGEGRCLDGPPGMRCNPDSNGLPRSLSYWQLERSACPALFDAEDGTLEALCIAADCANHIWWAQYWRCYSKNPDGPIAGAFSGYATGESCVWKPATQRAARWYAVRNDLGRLLHTP
jgi:hypothetical protein